MAMGKPKIRFKGYEDDWEQRKLDGWGTFYYGRSCPKWSVTEDATIPCIRYGELYTKFGAKIDRVYSYTNMPPENLRFSKGTEVLIPRVGEDPMDYNHCTWLSMPDVAIGEMISVFNTDNNPLFTATMFNATLQNEFAMRVEGGSVTNLYFEKLKNIEVSFPSIQEQEKIAAYFENLDHLITLHQRKCEETKSLKKYMLQKMFPENGKCVPKIRFSGFSDAWEQRKLGEIYGSIGNAFVGTATPYYVEQGHFYLESNNVKDGQINHNSEIFINDEFYEKQKDKWLHSGDVVMVQSGHVGHAAVIPKELNNTAAHALIMFRNPKEEIEPYFLNYEYQTDKVKKKIENITTGNTIKHILASDMQEFVVDVPKYEEQKVIASYFSHLDHLITLHQHKCDELQKLKKFMLQNMFV
jgi:type I restriction enzyme S subunit